MAETDEPSFGWDVDGAAEASEQSPREVAVDAPGASKTYTYAVPARLAGIEDGEAVLVEFGRSRQALGVVLGPARGELPVDAKPILARVRADGPLLPRLTLDFARWISEEYLAPPAATLRSMLPPGMLERLELVAELGPPLHGTDARAAADGEEQAVLERLADGPKAVRELEGADGRAAALRRLRSMSSRGLVSLEWTLTAASAGPRYERWLTLTDQGRDATASILADGSVPGVRLGARQRALLAELARDFDVVAVDLLGSKVPADVQRRVESDASVGSMAEAVRSRLSADKGFTFSESFRFQLRLLSSYVDCMRFIGLHFLPSPVDSESLQLPAPLYPVYYLTRPFRLAWKLGFRRGGL